MKKIIIGFIAFLVVFGGLGYFLYTSSKIPSVEQVETEVPAVPESLSGGKLDFSKWTAGLEKNGEVPVKVNADEMGKEDPFK